MAVFHPFFLTNSKQEMNILLSTVISILAFGAVADNGQTNNANAINKAIDYCVQNGGGQVKIPAGIFMTGTIFLKNNVTLILSKGAILKGSPILKDYQSLITKLDLSKYESGEGTVNYNSATDLEWSKALIFAVNIHNAGIQGDGLIDGDNVRNPKGEEHMRGPHTIFMAGCKKMTFSDFTIIHSGNYAFLAYQIEGTHFNRLKIRGGWDGIHVRGARHLYINNCNISTGDDALAGGYWDGAHITDCQLNSSCNGIRMIMPSKNVCVNHCIFKGPGKYVHQTSGRTTTESAINIQPGGWGKASGKLDNIYIQNCNIDNVLSPISVTLAKENTAGRIVIENLKAHDINHMAMSVKSWENSFADHVILKNVDIEFVGKDDQFLPTWFIGKSFSEWPIFPCWALYFRNINKVQIKNVRLRIKGKDYRPPIIYDNVKRKPNNKMYKIEYENNNYTKKFY